MILRSVIEHVRDQNWVAVGLDFLIVVVGVFIGIQVANWNAAQADRQSEQVILQRLQSDFERLLEIESGAISTVEAAAEGGARILELVSKDAAPTGMESMCASLQPARAFRPAPAPSPTYVQLVANGEMRLIGNEALRSALADFEIGRERHAIGFQGSLDTSLALSREFWRVVDICDASLRGGVDRFDTVINKRVVSPDFAGALSGIVTQHRNSLDWHQQTLSRIRRVLDLLDEERTRRGFASGG